MWRSSIIFVEEGVDSDGKGILACLAMGQTVHVKGCLDENLTGIVWIPFILTKGTCPNLVCHK